jgi:hypothetical protein
VLPRDSGNLERPTTSPPQAFVMYAIRPINEIYHLVTRGGQDTLCGLRVSRITFDRTGNRLQLVHQQPVDRTICKHCQRIRNQDAEE